MAEPPGHAARSDAGSSVAPIVTTIGAPCVRGLGTSIASRRRATSRQTLLNAEEGAGAPSSKLLRRSLRAGTGDDVGAWPGLLPRLRTDGRLDAVRGGRHGLDDDVLDARVVRRLE